jgi:hypothetical protein
VLFDKMDPILLQQELCNRAETSLLGEEAIAGTHKRPKWVPYYSAQVLLRYTQALLRYAHPHLRYTQALLGYAHPYLRYAHP